MLVTSHLDHPNPTIADRARRAGDRAASANGGTAEATIAWMTRDVSSRCREVLDSLTTTAPSAAELGNAATTLRAASDDLVALVELLEGPQVADGSDTGPTVGVPFGLSFRDAIDRNGSD